MSSRGNVIVADQSDPGRGSDHIQATRAEDGSYAFVYSASGRPFTLNLEKLTGEQVRAVWYDPRSGTTTAAGTFHRAGKKEFQPPSQGKGNDWVLVLDNPSRGYPEPGSPAR